MASAAAPPNTEEAPVNPPSAARRYKATVTYIDQPESSLDIGYMTIKLDLAAGEHAIYTSNILSQIREAIREGENFRVGTRVIITFDSNMQDQIATIEIAEGEDTLLTGAWEWVEWKPL